MAKKKSAKPSYGDLFKAAKSASNLLVLFIPSQDRYEQPIDQERWKDEALTALGKLFGGATAYPKGKGVWRDDEQGGKLLFDEPVVVQCYPQRGRYDAKRVPCESSWFGWAPNAAKGPSVSSSTGITWRYASPSPGTEDEIMARNIKQIAQEMGAEIVGQVPDTGGGAFGAARLPHVVNALRERLQPSRGRRPGRPTSKDWSVRSKVPMSTATRSKLRRLARQMSTTKRKVSPMQVAAQLLEEAVTVCPAD